MSESIPVTPAIEAAVAPGKDLDPSALPSAPIAVNTGTAVPAAVTAGVRYAVSAGLAFAVGKGWVGADDAAQIVGIVVALIPAAWGIYSAIKTHNDKKALEPFAPKQVAVAK